MAFLQRFDFTLTVNAGGAGTIFSAGPVMGEIRQISYVPDGSFPLATGAVLTITGEVSATPLITITGIGTVAVTFAPRQATHTTAAAAALYAAAGIAVLDRIALAGERIKVVISGGGVSMTGQLTILVG